ncbi:hypothetical protein [Tenacibaculum sp. 190524A05c]|uniref:YD repeat-containing protein n=1 Tax=Tenacibaculum platacis TaxID=3137852 RepID=A0ABM9NS50_9FLAO
MKKIVSGFLVMVSTIMLGQELPNVTPLSPEASSIGKYGQIPVGLFTGTPQVNVPICTFKSGPLSVPVSLNYSSNGIRIDEYASSVGLGWNLSAGGVITRSVYGKKDENQYRPAKNVNLAIGEDRFLYASAAADPGPESVDTQPDIFSFNFNGFSGKFYLDDNAPFFTDRDIIFLEPSPVKVEILNIGTENQFKITDPKGIVYYFGGENAIEKFKYDATNQADNPETYPLVPSAWFLTKIVHLNGEEINFSYERGSVIYKNSISQSVTKVDGFYNESDPCISTSSDKAYLNITQGYFSYLKEISSSRSGKVIFNYAQKQFMPNGFKQLNTIVVENVNQKIIKQFDLSYLLSEATGNINYDFTQENYYNKRYFLSSVLEKSTASTDLNPYVFEYNSPDNLPSRFSYAQDYWGFYNGKTTNRNLIDQDIINKLSSNFVLGNALSDFEGADRSPNVEFGQLGMLSSITYPTKGKNEFTYEGHSYYGEVTRDPLYVSKIANVNPTNTTGSFEVLNVVQDHKGWLNFGANLDDFVQDIGDTNNNLNFNIAEIDVFDITTNTAVGEEIFEASDIHGWRPISGVAYGITNLNFSKKKYVRLKKGHSYRFNIRLNSGYTLSHIKLDYFDQPSVVINENIPVGGVRIAQVDALDGNGKVETKKYHYGSMNCLNCDSGRIIDRKIEPTVYSNRMIFCSSAGSTNNPSQFCPTAECGNTTITSNTAFPLYGIQGYHIGYTNVVEELGNNFEGGAIEHMFEGDFSIAPNISVFGEELVPGMPYSNFYGFGRKVGEKIYANLNGEFKVVQEVNNEYEHKTSLDKETTIYAVRKAGTIVAGVGFVDDPNFTLQNSQYHISQYSLFRQWHVMRKRTTLNYDQNGENPFTTIENFFYDNPDHLQQTRAQVEDSKGKLVETKTIFPQDIAESNRTTAQQKLISLHKILEPIEVATSELEGNTTRRINKVYTEYQDFGTNLVLPKTVKTSKNTSVLESRVNYKLYDSYGNPVEVSKEGGGSIVYIWGYNYQYPLAKIENINYSQIQDYIQNIQTKSDLDIDRTIGDLGTEGALRLALNNLRNVLPEDALMTSYTYDPMIGVTSVTDPRGYTMYYEYDKHQRLKYVRDEDGNLISENKYNYKK